MHENTGKAQIPLRRLSSKLPSGKSWTQTISTCPDICDKSVTNPFVSL